MSRLLDLSSEQLRDVVHSRARRRFNRGLKRKPMALIKKLRKAKQEAKPNEKPDLVKTHLRDMIIGMRIQSTGNGLYNNVHSAGDDWQRCWHLLRQRVQPKYAKPDAIAKPKTDRTIVEIKPEMVGHYLAEFSISCK